MRRPGKHRGWFGAIASIVKVFLHSFTRHEWTGLENIPRNGGAIVVANHVTVLDPLTLSHAVYVGAHRLPRFLAKAELFKIAPIRFLFRRAGQIPVYRGTRDAATSLRDAEVAVRDGECVIIYPEGTCTSDPELWPMSSRTGVARLALSTRATVIPVAHWGSHKILPFHARKPSLFPRKMVQVIAGPAIDLSAYYDRPQTPELLRTVTDLVMGQVTDLLGELRHETPPKTPYDPRTAKAAA